MLLERSLLMRLGAELDAALAGRTVQAVHLQRQALCLAVDRRAHLQIHWGLGGHILWQEGRLPAGPPTAGPERYLPGATVVRVQTDRRDRVLRLVLQRDAPTGEATYGQLVCEWLPKRLTLVLFSERTGGVLGAWGHTKFDAERGRIRPGQPYGGLPSNDKVLPPDDGEAAFREALTQRPAPLGQALGHVLAGIGPSEAQHIVAQAGVDPQAPAAQLPSDQQGALWQAAVQQFASIATGPVYVWRIADGRWACGHLPPADAQPQTFAEAGPAVAAAARAEGQERVLAQKTRQGVQVLQRQIKSLRKRLAALHRDLEAAADEQTHQQWGNTLLAQLHKVPPGSKEAVLDDIYATGPQTVRIPLERRLSPAENAARYLKNARKFARRRRQLPVRIRQQQELLDQLEQWRQQVSEDPDRLQQATEWLERNGMKAAQNKPGKATVSQAHPRRYRTSDGWSVWAGRNNRENDIISHRLAAQRDLWFHAHGYAGSHVILRREGRKEEPSRQALEETAAVAAYWSKGKTAKKVPVIYTEAKFVSKPRGGAPGLAVVRREKTLMVQPRLLPEEDA